MFNIVICEIKKLKRTWLLSIISVFILIWGCNLPLNTSIIKSVDELFTWVNMTVFSYGFLAAINILTAYMFLGEFKNNTMSVMLSYRYKRWEIFIGKLIAIIIVSLFFYLVEFGILTFLGFISFRDTFTLAVLTKHFIITIRSFVFQMLMITVTACITLISKNIIVPIIYIGIQLVASFVFLIYKPIRAYIPFPLPVISNLMLVKDTYKFIDDISIMSSAVIIAVVMFIGGIVGGCLYINKMEVS